MSDHIEAIIHDLSAPAAYPHRPATVRVVQTHISVVFVTDDLVYKVKKPVSLGFLDFSTVQQRKHFCHQEVILNSRFSRGIYLGVVPIYRGSSGYNLIGDGEEVDFAVLMRHIPEERLMSSMLERDLITPEKLDELAARLAYYHSIAATGPEIARFGGVDVIYRNVEENFKQTLPYIGRAIDLETHAETSYLAKDFLFVHENLFRERVRGGFIRDCHGDLHLDHVVMLDEIMLYDCIEFNDRFRYGDTAADLGFLLMDLDYWGFPVFSRLLGKRYAEVSEDGDILRLIGFYKSYRAFVRGKVAALTLDEPEISDEEKAHSLMSASGHFRLARAYFKPDPPPTLIITVGLIGTGKTRVATGLGKRLAAQPLASDVIRKEIHGIDKLEHHLDKFERGLYTANATERTYGELLDRARQALQRGESAILDASFIRYHHREAARDLARECNARFRIIQCTATDNVIHERLSKRILLPDEPSDGRWELLDSQKARFQPFGPDESADLRTWDSTTDLCPFLAAFVRELLSS